MDRNDKLYIWPSLCREWRRVEIYRTPDGLNEEPTPALAWDVMPA